MKTYVSINEIKRGILFGSTIIFMLAIFGADAFFPAPKISSLEVFTGRIDKVELIKKHRRWRIVLISPNDRRVFYIPSDLCCSLETVLPVGETATAKLHRRMPIGVIQAWQMEVSGKEILSYHESKERRKSLKELLISCLIGLIATSIGGIMIEISRRPKRRV